MAEDSAGSASDCQDKSLSLTQLDSTHLFVDLDPLDDLLQPIKLSGRIKYTCLAVCSQYIALGASTGSVYIFQKENLKYLLQLTSNDGSISRLAFSRSCKRLAVVTGDGLIVVWELNIEQRKVPVRILMSTTHTNEVVTSLVWDDSGKRVFAGDVRGWVSITNIDSKKPSGLFKLLSEVILKADSAIVQLDFFKNDLLVSTLTRCHICFTKRKKCATVGTKLRDGQFGACYWSRPANHDIGETLLLSARPGSRIWEASIQGEVQKTHQFKKLLAVPPLPVVSSKRSTVYPSSNTPIAAQSLVFSQLYPIGDHFLLAVAASGLYILNPESVEAVFWTNSIQDVKSMAVFGKDVYCLHSDQTLCKYTLCRVAHCAAKLYRRNLFQESLRLCLTFQKCIKSNSSRCHLPIQMMKDLLQKVKEADEFEEMVLKKFEETLADMEARFVETVSTASSQSGSTGSVESNSVRLESGIHVVVRRRNDSDNSVCDQQDEITVKEDINGVESVIEKSELQIGVGAGVDETDHPMGVVVKQGEGLEGEQRSQGVITEDENEIFVEDGKVNSKVKDHVRDEKYSEFKGHSELVSQEEDSDEKNGNAFMDGGTLTSNDVSNNEVHRELKEENDKPEGTLNETNSQQLDQLGVVKITGQSPMDTSCQPSVSSCNDAKHSDSAEQSSSNLSSNSKHVTNSSTPTHCLVLSSNAPCRVLQKSPGDDKGHAKLLNSELDSKSSREEAVILGEGYDNGEDETDIQCQFNDDKNKEELSFLPRTSESDESIPKHRNRDINSDGIDGEIEDDVFISSKEEKAQSWVETSFKEEGEASFDDNGGKVDEDHMQQENGIRQSTDETFEDVDSLVIDGNKVLYREMGFGKGKNVEPETNIDGAMEVVSSDGRDMLQKERDLTRDVGRKTETAVLGQKELGEIGTSPDTVPPFLRKDSSSTVEEDAKLIAIPTRLTEKSKKLKKSRKAARVVDIGTVMGQNAKNAKVSLKSPMKKTLSSPIPVSVSGVPPSPPVTSPSYIPPSPDLASPTRIPPSLQLSPTFQNGRDLKSPKLSPVIMPSVLQPDENSGRIEMKAGDDVIKSTDGLANIGHSFKVVTRSLSQKLNKKSPLKRFKSLPSSPQPTLEEDSVLEVKVHAYSHHKKILEEATEMARFQLNDQSICSDTKTKKATLTIWLKVFQDVFQTVIKQEKQFGSDNTSSLEPSDLEEHTSLTNRSISESECEVEKSSNGMTSSDPHSYVNESTIEPVRSQVFSPSATVRALHALEMDEELYMTCCHLVMDCFQFEVFQARDEEKVEADREGFEIDLINGRQAQAEPLNRELKVVKNSPVYADASHLNGEVQFLEEFPSNNAEDVNAPTDMTPPNQGGAPTDMTPPNQDGALLSSTSELILETGSVETDACVSHSSKDTQKLRKAAKYIQRSSTWQEVSSVLDVTMEMGTERDQLASHFVWQYLPLLDTYRVRDVLDSWTVREQTFGALLGAKEEISDDSIWIKFQDLNSENVDDILRQVKAMVREKPVLAMSCLCRLQEMTSDHFDMSDILHWCYPNIRMWEAVQICKNGDKTNKSIVSYMTLRMNSVHEGSRDTIFQSEFQNMSLRRSLLSAALTYNCPDRTELFCSVCDVEPIPLSNHIIWPQEELIRHCINVCRANENLQGMLEECHQHGYWLGVLELLKVKGQRQKSLDMVLKLADQKLLCEEKGFKPQSFAEWHQVLQFLDMYLKVLQMLPWQHLSSMCVSCSKIAEAEKNESQKELQEQLIHTDKSAEFDKMEESVTRQESDFSNEVKCSEGSGQEENSLSELNSGISKDFKESQLSAVGNDGKHDDIEISESKVETSFKLTDDIIRDGQEKTQKVQRNSSSSSPEHSSWTEVSPDHQPRSQLTWEYVAKLLVGCVGAAHALKVLQAYDIPQGALTHDFYLKCLQSASIEAKQNSSHPGEKQKEEIILTMHPLLKEYIELEVAQDGLPAKDSKRWLPISDKFGPTKIHWGRTIDLNSDCQLCGWSLQSFKTDVCVYACGHTYHSGCTSGDSCVICV